MRLSRELINHIARAIAANLERKGMTRYEVPANAVSEKIAAVIAENMLAEDRLNAEVGKILSAHEAEIARGQMDYRKVFELTKQKLAKERGMVL